MEELTKYVNNPFDDFRVYEDKLVTLQNLNDIDSIYRNLIKTDSVYTESTDYWLSNKDKKLVLISLLNKAIINEARHKGMWHNHKTNKLFFSSTGQKRFMSWPAKFKTARRTVANQVYASQLKTKIFLHPAITTTFIELGDKFFLQINPTFVITIDGKKVLSGLREGTIITKVSYNKYNDAHLNNVLFWSNKLGDGNDIIINPDFIISSKPIGTSTEYGISWDIPTTELKYMIEHYKPEADLEEISMGENNDKFTV